MHSTAQHIYSNIKYESLLWGSDPAQVYFCTVSDAKYAREDISNAQEDFHKQNTVSWVYKA